MGIQDLGSEKLLWIYEHMFKIRAFEERVRKEFAAGNLPGFVHLYAGQEATAVGVCANLRPDDAITSTHRGHGHCVAKGVSLKAMFAELQAKATGLCRGKGGSMHMADLEKGVLGANGVVGAGIPIATGAGLGFKYQGRGQVCVCFFGDGAVNQGTFHEAINLAATWKLPVIFVCDNNGYAECTPIHYHMACKNVSDRAVAYAIPGETVDGTDVLQVYTAAKRAVDRARRGEGPSLIDSRCFRIYGHYEGDPQRYKTAEEREHYGELDPVGKFTSFLLTNGVVSKAQVSEIESAILAEIDAAWEHAQRSPLPKPEEALEDVYVAYP